MTLTKSIALCGDSVKGTMGAGKKLVFVIINCYYFFRLGDILQGIKAMRIVVIFTSGKTFSCLDRSHDFYFILCVIFDFLNFFL